MRVLVTRPKEDAERFARELAIAGHVALFSPVMEIEALAAQLPTGSFDIVIATSAHAFTSGAALNIYGLEDVPVWAVGERTAKAARAAGFRTIARVCANSAELAANLLSYTNEASGLLYLAGVDRKTALEERLLRSKRRITVVETYRGRAALSLDPTAVEAMRRGELDAAVHFSRRSAAIFAGLVAAADLVQEAQKLLHVCLSDDVARGLDALKLKRVRIAGKPTGAAMIEALH